MQKQVHKSGIVFGWVFSCNKIHLLLQRLQHHCECHCIVRLERWQYDVPRLNIWVSCKSLCLAILFGARYWNHQWDKDSNWGSSDQSLLLDHWIPFSQTSSQQTNLDELSVDLYVGWNSLRLYIPIFLKIYSILPKLFELHRTHCSYATIWNLNFSVPSFLILCGTTLTADPSYLHSRELRSRRIEVYSITFQNFFHS